MSDTVTPVGATGADVRGAFPWTALTTITILALVLRLIGLNDGLWWDEIRTLVDSVRSPLHRIVTVYPGDNQHTLFSVLAHGSIALFGEHAWSLRLPSVVFGVATVPVLYLFAREVTGRAEALAAALLLAVSYHHIWFSQSARGYAALALFALLCSLLLVRWLQRGRLADAVWYGIVAAAAIYTHVTMVFLVASHVLLCVIPLGVPRPRSPAWNRWRGVLMGASLAAVLSVALHAPFMLAVREAVVDAPAPMQGSTPAWALIETLKGIQIGLGSAAVGALAVVVFAAGVISYLRQGRFVVGMFLLPGVMTVGAAVLLQRPVRPRFLFFLAGFLLLVVVRGAVVLGRRMPGGRGRLMAGVPVTSLGVIALLAAFSLASLPRNYRYPKQDFIGAMAYLDANAGPREPILTAGGARFPYSEYFARDWDNVRSLGQLEQVRSLGHRVWVVHTMDAYIRSDAPDLMRALETQCSARRTFVGTVGDGDITVCSLAPLTPSPPIPRPT